MIEKMQGALSRLSDWFFENRLEINANKTQMIVFGTKAMLKNVPLISLTFNGSVITGFAHGQLHDFRYISSVVAKCSGTLIALMHARHSLPKSSIKPISNALVISSLRCCVSIYRTCTKTELHRIQKVQNFAAGAISGLKKHGNISVVIQDMRTL